MRYPAIPAYPPGTVSTLTYSQLNDLIGFIVAYAALKVGDSMQTLKTIADRDRYPRRKTPPKTSPSVGSDLDSSVHFSTAFSSSRWVSAYSCNLSSDSFLYEVRHTFTHTNGFILIRYRCEATEACAYHRLHRPCSQHYQCFFPPRFVTIFHLAILPH